MKEFDPRDLWKLQEVNGMVLRDIHGIDVAIGKGFEYKNIKAFIEVYTTEYGVNDFMKKRALKIVKTLLNIILKSFPMKLIGTMLVIGHLTGYMLTI